MNITADFSQINDRKRRTNGDSRLALTIAIQANPDETSLIRGIRFAPGSTPIPARLYHFADRDVITAATDRPIEYKGEILKSVPCFMKAGLPILSYVPGALLRLCYPAKTLMGYVNPQDHDKLKAWLEVELEKIADQIERAVNEVRAETSEQKFTSTSASRRLAKSATKAPVDIPARPSVTIQSQAGRSVCFV